MTCREIRIQDEYRNRCKLIPHFINGDIDQPNPSFSSLNSISKLYLKDSPLDIWMKNLEMISKASIHIDEISTSDARILNLSEYYGDKFPWIDVETINLSLSDTNKSKQISIALINLNYVTVSYILILIKSQKLLLEN